MIRSLYAPGYQPPPSAVDCLYTPLGVAQQLVALLAIAPHELVVEPSAGAGGFAEAVRMQQPRALLYLVEHDAEQARRLRDAAGDEDRIVVQHGDWLATTFGPEQRPDWIVGNPPYEAAEAHVEHALQQVEPVAGRVAMLLGIGFLAGQARARGLWARHPPRDIYVLSRRVAHLGRSRASRSHREGRLLTGRETSDRDQLWIVWDRAYRGPTRTWWLCPDTGAVLVS